jgi:hypothetical protein
MNVSGASWFSIIPCAKKRWRTRPAVPGWQPNSNTNCHKIHARARKQRPARTNHRVTSRAGAVLSLVPDHCIGCRVVLERTLLRHPGSAGGASSTPRTERHVQHRPHEGVVRTKTQAATITGASHAPLRMSGAAKGRRRASPMLPDASITVSTVAARPLEYIAMQPRRHLTIEATASAHNRKTNI